jgi:hypothetical protein
MTEDEIVAIVHSQAEFAMVDFYYQINQRPALQEWFSTLGSDRTKVFNWMLKRLLVNFIGNGTVIVENNFELEIAALTPDATAWRDRQVRFESEKQEMQERIDDCRNGVKSDGH